MGLVGGGAALVSSGGGISSQAYHTSTYILVLNT